MSNDWIRKRLAALGLTRASLAEALNLPAPRITEMIKGGRKIQAREIPALARFLQLSESEITRAVAEGGEPAAPAPRRAALTPVPLAEVMVIGAVQAGVFREALEWDQEDWKPAPVAAMSLWRHARQFGLDVRGPSMNRVFPDGSTVVCVPWMEAGVEPTDKMRVVVQRRAAKGSEVFEATIKELEIKNDGSIWLCPRSTDPRYQEPWPVESLAQSDDNDDLRIVALVIGSFIPEPMATPAARRLSAGPQPMPNAQPARTARKA